MSSFSVYILDSLSNCSTYTGGGINNSHIDIFTLMSYAVRAVVGHMGERVEEDRASLKDIGERRE